MMSRSSLMSPGASSGHWFTVSVREPTVMVAEVLSGLATFADEAWSEKCMILSRAWISVS